MIFSLILIFSLMSACGNEENEDSIRTPQSGNSAPTIDSGNTKPTVSLDGYWKSDLAFVTPKMTKRFFFKVDGRSIDLIMRCQLTGTTTSLISRDKAILQRTASTFEIIKNHKLETSERVENQAEVADRKAEDELGDLCVAEITNSTGQYAYKASTKVMTISTNSSPFPTHLYPVTEDEVLGTSIF